MNPQRYEQKGIRMKLFKNFKLISRSKSFSLNLFSLFVLFLTDILLATIIFHGLSEQIDQLTNEYEYFPHKYRQALIRSNWVENNIISKISDCVLRAPIYREEKTHKKRHPVCDEFDAQINALKNDPDIVTLFKKLRRLQKTYQNYDNYQKNKLNLADSTYKEIQSIAEQLRETPLVNGTVQFVFAKQKENYIDDIKAYKRSFAFKRTGYGLLFLVPIIALLCLWNRQANKKEKNLSIIISSHFIIVALLPILFEITRLLLEFLPHVLFKSIYEFLISSKLISLWYYGVIFVIVAAISILIWFLQTKVFTQKRYLRNRIQKSTCTQCGLKASYDNPYCPHCGNKLLRVCRSCSQLTIKEYDYCQHCGR